MYTMPVIAYLVAVLCLMTPFAYGRDSTGKYVRIVGAGGKYNVSPGRVEIFISTYFGSGWATTCHSEFDDDDANVVCNQVGFTSGTVASDVHIPGSGLRSPYTWPCTGDESSLYSCWPRGWLLIYCYHHNDVVVNCVGDKTRTPRG